MNDFETLFEELKGLNNPELVKSCRESQKEKKRNTLIIVAIFAVLILSEVMFAKEIEALVFKLFISIYACIFAFIIITIGFSKKQKHYKKFFKETMIKRLIENFYDNIKYFPNESLPREIYDEGQYNESYNRYYADDYVSAKIDYNYDIQIADLDVKRHTSSGKSSHTVTLFHGLFAKINLNKSIGSEILIRNNGNLFFDKKLKMDSQEFEKYFDIASKDDIKTMQILTHDVMEELISFRENSKILFDISIINQYLYIRFNTGSMFEKVPKNIENLDPISLKKYYDILDFTKRLSKMLIKTIDETKL